MENIQKFLGKDYIIKNNSVQNSNTEINKLLEQNEQAIAEINLEEYVNSHDITNVVNTNAYNAIKDFGIRNLAQSYDLSDNKLTVFPTNTVDGLNSVLKELFTSSGSTNLDTGVLDLLVDAFIEYIQTNDVPVSDIPDLITSENGFKGYAQQRGYSVSDSDLMDATSVLHTFAKNYATNEDGKGLKLTLNNSLQAFKNKSQEVLFNSKDTISQLFTSDNFTNLKPDILNHLIDALIIHIKDNNIPNNLHQINELINSDNGFNGYLKQKGIKAAPTDLSSATNALLSFVNKFSASDNNNELSLTDINAAIRNEQKSFLNNSQGVVKELLIANNENQIGTYTLNQLNNALLEYLENNEIPSNYSDIKKLVNNEFKTYLSKNAIRYSSNELEQEELDKTTDLLYSIVKKYGTNGSLSKDDLINGANKDANSLNDTKATINQILTSSSATNINPEILDALTDALIEYLGENEIPNNQIASVIEKQFNNYLNILGINHDEQDLAEATTILQRFAKNYSALDGSNNSISMSDLVSATKNKSKEILTDQKKDVTDIFKYHYNVYYNNNGNGEAPIKNEKAFNALTDALIAYLPGNNIPKNQISSVIDNQFADYLKNQGITYTNDDLKQIKNTLSVYLEINSKDSLTLTDLTSDIRNHSASLLKNSNSVINEKLDKINEDSSIGVKPDILNSLTDYLIEYVQNHEIPANQVSDIIENQFATYLKDNKIYYKQSDLDGASEVLRKFVKQNSKSDSVNNSLSITDVVNTLKNSVVNGKIDDYVKQGVKNDCWLLAGVLALNSVKDGQKIIRDAIRVNSNGDVTVTFKGAKDENGNSVQYRIKKSDLEKYNSDYLMNTPYSIGDNDMLALELATEQLRKEYPNLLKEQYDLNYNEEIEISGIDSGSAGEMILYLTGNRNYTNNKSSDEIFEQALKNGNNAITFGLANGKTTPHTAKLTDGTTFTYDKGSHGFAITDVSVDDKGKKTVTFVNPWDSATKYTMTWSEFKKLAPDEIWSFDFSNKQNA